LWLTNEVDSVFSASFCLKQGLVGLLEEFFYCLAVTGEVRRMAKLTCQATESNKEEYLLLMNGRSGRVFL